jgi:hypothetical protein
MMNEMAMELSILKMGAIMKENGKMIKCMVLGNCITRMVRLLMRGIGRMMNLMGKGEFTTCSL